MCDPSLVQPVTAVQAPSCDEAWRTRHFIYGIYPALVRVTTTCGSRIEDRGVMRALSSVGAALVVGVPVPLGCKVMIVVCLTAPRGHHVSVPRVALSGRIVWAEQLSARSWLLDVRIQHHRFLECVPNG